LPLAIYLSYTVKAVALKFPFVVRCMFVVYSLELVPMNSG